MLDDVDLAVHLPHPHPLDPFNGSIITRGTDDGPLLVQADEHVLLDCGFLWDVVANEAIFAPWCRLFPPVSQLDLRPNFNAAPGFALLGLNFPSNRPTAAIPWPICQHWTMVLTVGGRTTAYRIGSYRPSVNAMEASWTV